MSCVPNWALVTVKVSSTKNSASEAKNRVSRCLDYITQNLQKPDVQAENITVTKDISRIGNAYHMEAEVSIIFSEFEKMQDICNLFVEKLDSSVIINPPHFNIHQELLRILDVKFVSVLLEMHGEKLKKYVSLLVSH
ncbi:interleukin-1 receptor-associated kinase 1-binding protein 1-like [Monodelphis domestica]|uniref:interleukin-1 receptor-associated kinase 1-binding protein 1-like n=1 Tax=Monodelphis domestica TaxID=13616 RepID=UPI0024E25500|nr:interleukin-1 receptor-associated kinase 1-binding protein 1-like [Monodelphis domestica]